MGEVGGVDLLTRHFRNDNVTAPILGTSSGEHLEEAAEALEIELSESDVEYLEEPYEPVPVYGHEEEFGGQYLSRTFVTYERNREIHLRP